MARDAAPASAVVFAYHNVGVRCLRVLLDAGIDVRLVVTHRDDASENVWFDSVAELAREHQLACITPESANDARLLEQCRAAAPDFLFSFYYRFMLPEPLLATATRGAYNMHGSLLPKYRGRAPVNWAILQGERETGATLHLMDAKPDHGAIVDQCAVPILGDDAARQVFDKVTLAAEIVMARALSQLVDGTATLTPQRLDQGRYFGGRRPDDGRIAAHAGARSIHDLVRAVAPPEYPGAFFDAGGRRIGIASTRLDAGPARRTPGTSFTMLARDGRLVIDACDGATVQVLAATLDGTPCDTDRFLAEFGPRGAQADA